MFTRHRQKRMVFEERKKLPSVNNKDWFIGYPALSAASTTYGATIQGHFCRRSRWSCISEGYPACITASAMLMVRLHLHVAGNLLTQIAGGQTNETTNCELDLIAVKEHTACQTVPVRHDAKRCCLTLPPVQRTNNETNTLLHSA